MIHTNRIVTVGEQESIIDRPIVLYRGDREVEIEFTLVGNEFTFSEEGNVIKSVNASHGQLVLNTPSGENMFSELAECNEGKVVFVVTKEMIDEFIEVGFYSFQIRLYDSAEQTSRVTLPPILNGFDIRNPIAAEDETNVVDQGIVDYARVFKDQSNEELSTFDWQGNYIKTEWVHHDVITENKLNKIEDALYTINANVKESDTAMLNTLDQVKNDADAYVKEHIAEFEADVDEFERNINTEVGTFKVDVNAAMTTHKNEVSEVVDGFSGEIESINTQLADIENNHLSISVKDFGAVGDGITDDTEAIKKAFNSVSNNHTTIFFPKGIYKVTDTLSISDIDFVTITGDASISAECYRIFEIRNCNHLTVNNLNIEGNSYCNKGLSIYNSKYSNVLNVKVQNMGNTTTDNIGGIELIGDCSFSTIRNCKVFNMISSAVAFGIMLSSKEDTFSRHCLIDNCLIDTVSPSADSDGIKFLQLGMSSYSTVSNCTILNCDKRAIKVQTEFVDIYNCYCEGKMGYAGIDFQCGNGTATNCTLKFTAQYYIGIAICGANATLKNIKILNDNYDEAIMSSGIRLTTLYSSLEDSLGDIIIDNVYCNNAKYGIIWSTSAINYAKSLKILNMTLENIYATYMFQFNGATVDFFQLENLTMLTKPDTIYNVVTALTFNNCIIKNNNVLGQRILSEEHSVKTKQIIYHEEIGGSYYIPYVQQDNHRVYKFNSNPMYISGSNGKIFNQSIVGDRCKNTNTTITTSGDTSYIVTEWVCTSPSDETNVRGVWQEIKQYI